jgi:hypothetical protein
MTQQEVEFPLHSSPEELMAYYAQECRSYGKVTELKLFCHAEYPKDAFCMISLNGNAHAAATALGAHRAGTTLCRIVPLTPQFTCANRREGGFHTYSCNACRLPVPAD